MSLLTPLFLFGLVALALPLWLHRLHTESPEKQPFSSTRLLQTTEQRIHWRKRLRFWLLLALRLLLLVLLALAFAKPVLQRAPQVLAASERFHLLVIDTSLSMGHGNRFEEGLAAARDVIATKGAADMAQIVLASNDLTIATEPSADQNVLQRGLFGLGAGPGHLQLGELMDGLTGLIDDLADGNSDIVVHLISDFQVSALPTRFADLVPEVGDQSNVTLNVHPVARGDASNWTVESIVFDGQVIDVAVRSFNAEASSRTVTLTVNEVPTGSLEKQVPENGRSIFSFQLPTLAAGSNRIKAQLAPADPLVGDDIRYAVVDNAPPQPVLLITADKESLPATYVSTALATLPRGYVSELVNVGELDNRILPRYPWIVIDDLGIVSDKLATAIDEYLRNGGAVLAAVGEAALGRATLPVTDHDIPATLTTLGSRFRSIGNLDLSHPILASSRGWHGVHVTRALPLAIGPRDRVLISLDNDLPFLLERQFDGGRLLLLTGALDNYWSDLPVQPVFVSFIAGAAHYLAEEELLDSEQLTGNALRLQKSARGAGQIVDPDGRTVLGLADTQQGRTVKLDQTGFYEVYTPVKESLIAVNVDPRESDLTMLSAAALKDWQAAIDQPAAAGNQALGGLVQDRSLELWRVLLALLFLFVLLESLLGNRLLSFKTGSWSSS